MYIRPLKFMTPFCIKYIVYSDTLRIMIALGFSKTSTTADTYLYLVQSNVYRLSSKMVAPLQWGKSSVHYRDCHGLHLRDCPQKSRYMNQNCCGHLAWSPTHTRTHTRTQHDTHAYTKHIAHKTKLVSRYTMYTMSCRCQQENITQVQEELQLHVLQ